MEQMAEALLSRTLVGHFTTIGKDGYPYTIAVNYVYFGGNFYFHCGKRGEKLENIRENDQVCFTVDEMIELKNTGIDAPCKTSICYESVIARGRAAIVSDEAKRNTILKEIAKKFSPEVADIAMPDEVVAKTNLVEIVVENITFKEHGKG